MAWLNSIELSPAQWLISEAGGPFLVDFLVRSYCHGEALASKVELGLLPCQASGDTRGGKHKHHQMNLREPRIVRYEDMRR